MTTEGALGEFLVAQTGGGKKDWYAGYWFYTTIFGVKVPLFPRIGFRQGLPAHDTHHMLNDYATNWVGECETAAWELASGGCGPYIAYWIDRLFFLAIAFAMTPRRTTKAWRRGSRQKNLYRLDPARRLKMNLADVRRYASRGESQFTKE